MGCGSMKFNLVSFNGLIDCFVLELFSYKVVDRLISNLSVQSTHLQSRGGGG